MADQTLIATVVTVESNPTRNNQPRWIVKTDDGNAWTTFDPALAMKASQFQQQQALLQVTIEPSRNGQYTNYNLREIGPAGGAAPGTMMGPMQPSSAMGMPGPGAYGGPPANPTYEQNVAAAIPLAQGKQQSLGQGGNFSDADVWRMARSTGITVAAQVFHGAGEDLDFVKFYGLAEAVAKHVVSRAHQGWVPGIEVLSPKPKPEDVAATVNAAAGEEAVQVGVPETPTPEGSQAATATGGEVEWD